MHAASEKAPGAPWKAITVAWSSLGPALSAETFDGDMGRCLTGAGARCGRPFDRRRTIRAGRGRVNAGDATGAGCAMVRHRKRDAMNDPVRPPRPDELDLIESASRDEIEHCSSRGCKRPCGAPTTRCLTTRGVSTRPA